MRAILTIVVAVCGVLATGCPSQETKALQEQCEDPALFYFYTESPCRQDPFCANPSRPDVKPEGQIYDRWWCKIVHGTLYRCLWPAPRGLFSSYDEYYEHWHARRSEMTPCDGEEDECTIAMGWATKLGGR